jgi:uncharacterized paraquat-inducible protein A
MERIGHFEKREDERSQIVAVGTLACPECDAPVAPGPLPLAPHHALSCPVCGHGAAVREFLSLAQPSRPARVAVRVSLPRLTRA